MVALLLQSGQRPESADRIGLIQIQDIFEHALVVVIVERSENFNSLRLTAIVVIKLT